MIIDFIVRTQANSYTVDQVVTSKPYSPQDPMGFVHLWRGNDGIEIQNKFIPWTAIQEIAWFERK